MPDELIDVLTPDGSPAGFCKPKREIHRDGDWHRSVHVWLATPDNNVLLQLRAPGKENHPGLWDVSAAGHVSAGETPEEAAIRETGEELGISITPAQLELIGRLRERWVLNDGRYLDNEFHDIYLVRGVVETGTLTLQHEEVAGVALAATRDLRARVARRDPALVPHWAEYELLLARFPL